MIRLFTLTLFACLFSIASFAQGTINGTTHVCAGSSVTLSDTTSGGHWSSSNTGIATVGSSTGIVTGVSAGTCIISYGAGTGTFGSATIVFTVNPSPAPMYGVFSLCVGGTTLLADTSAGGTWTSNTPGVATISSGGLVSGISAGNSLISYFIGSCYTTHFVTVNPAPSAISGGSGVTVGSTLSLSDGITGGTWSSSNTGVATVGVTSGLVTGVTAGIAIITYTMPGGCFVIQTVQVSGLIISPINGAQSVCVGSSITLTDTTLGGHWSSTNTAVATVGSSTGIVTGVSAGVCVISYTVGTSSVTITFTVNPLPVVISGPTMVCVGLAAALSDATPGGTWSSGNPGIATVSSGGVVSGVAAGAAVITYAIGSCYTTVLMTVNPNPSISGTRSVCVGGTTSLSSSPGGGTWTSGTPAVATIAATGVVTGVSTGFSVISYILPTGCITTTVVTVNASSTIIPTGPVSICLGGTAALTDATTGGVWSSTNTSVATVGVTGIVTGVGIGTSTISYTVSTGCSAAKIVTVNNAPAAITPHNPTICAGTTVLLSDLTSGGTWLSTVTGVATISTGGLVTALAGGVTEIDYSIGTCIARDTVFVVAGPAPITPGSLTLCLGSNGALTDAVAGGTWSSSATGIASVTSGGLVTGNAVGTARITYTIGSCYTTVVVTVNNGPAAITPHNPTMCYGSTLLLSDATAGGVWSAPGGIITVSSGGLVSTLSLGFSEVDYSIGSCIARDTVDVIMGPAAITPSPVTLCLGGSRTLSDATIGGAWSSSATGIVSVTSGGVITGNAIGTATISYTVGSCSATTVVTVNSAPGSISPTNPSVCVGSTVTLSDATTGGAWSSSNTAVATVAGGVVTGVSAGTATISYAVGSCSSTRIVTVNPSPASISGGSTVGAGSTITLSDATAGGTWSSSNTSMATVGSLTGVVTGVSAGTVTIYYTTAAGCQTSKVVVVTALTGINGTANVCAGSTRTLTDATSGGTWSSSNTGIATVGLTSGIVTGVSAGTCTISYTVGTSTTTITFTVYVAPGTISGSGAVTAGSNITLSDAVAGGTWSSSNSSVATVGSSTGIVTGVAPGTATITYTTAGGCFTTKVITVTSITGISGTASVCAGSTRTLLDSTAGGHWSSSNTAIATVGSSTGIVTGVSAGTCTITYTVGTGFTTITFTVYAMPSSISGSGTLIAGTTITLSDAVTGGTWSSSNIAVATVGSSTGIVTGVAPGTVTISYTTTGGCQTTRVLTVTPLTGIGGTASVCAGSTRTLTDATAGGHWSSSNTAIATVGSSTGVVTGVAAGTCIITYTLGTANVTVIFTVNPAPAAISGGSTIIVGFTMTLSDATAGGTWSSSNTGIATVGSSSGLVTAVSPGTVSIIYTIPGGCQSTRIVTVTPLPGIRGTANVCLGSSVTLTDSISGGHWSSSNTAIATVGSSTGVVTGIAAGTCTLTYTVGTNITTILFTVNFAPPISGSATVGVGGTITLSDASPGGTWLSGYTPAATVGSATGIVTGIATGTATIYYVTTAGCYASLVVTVSTPIHGIHGTASVCTGSTVTLNDSTAGGHWSSSNTAIATVGSATGVVTGVSGGTCIITYTVGSSFTTIAFTVNYAPAIMGSASIVVGGHTTLSDAAPGGTWLSGLTPVATVGSSTGVVTGVSAGTATIYYVLAIGCTAHVIVTVHATARHASTVTTTVGATVNIANEEVSGEWVSSDNNIATVDANGLVTAMAAGNVDIVHTTTDGEGATTETLTQITVGAVPMDVRLVPNPNKGSFAVKGIVGIGKDEEVTIEITNMMGQVVYSAKATATGGMINEQVLLNNNLENGMYLLDVRNGSEHKTFHFVMEK